MSKEISVSLTFSATKNGATMAPGNDSKSIDMSGNTFINDVQVIGATATALSFGAVTADETIGRVSLKNLDTTNWVAFSTSSPANFAAATTGGFCALPPGEVAYFPTRNGTLYGIAQTASVNVRVCAVAA